MSLKKTQSVALATGCVLSFMVSRKTLTAQPVAIALSRNQACWPKSVTKTCQQNPASHRRQSMTCGRRSGIVTVCPITSAKPCWLCFRRSDDASLARKKVCLGPQQFHSGEPGKPLQEGPKSDSARLVEYSGESRILVASELVDGLGLVARFLDSVFVDGFSQVAAGAGG